MSIDLDRWCFLNDKQEWQPYDGELNTRLHAAPPAAVLDVGPVGPFKDKYRLDLATKTQRNMRTGVERDFCLCRFSWAVEGKLVRSAADAYVLERAYTADVAAREVAVVLEKVDGVMDKQSMTLRTQGGLSLQLRRKFSPPAPRATQVAVTLDRLLDQITAPKVDDTDERGSLATSDEFHHLAERISVSLFCVPVSSCVVRQFANKSKMQSEAARSAVLSRVKSSEAVFDRLRCFFAHEAPVICHIDIWKKLPGKEEKCLLEALISDTHYRNQFETRTTGGYKFKAVQEDDIYSNSNPRFQWESRVFDGEYDTTRTAFLRPKYGCMNFFMDPFGVKQAHQYGTSYLVLRGVRERVTVSSDDSSAANGLETATPQHMLHVIDKFTEEELAAAVSIALKKSDTATSTISKKYKEVQIHGEVRLDEHVAVLVVPHSTLASEEGDGTRLTMKRKTTILEEFCARCGCTMFVAGQPGATRDSDARTLRQLTEDQRTPPKAAAAIRVIRGLETS